MAAMYLLYVDESGQREYGEKTSRYFVLCGLAVPVESWRQINTDIYNLKRACFKTPLVELKSHWLRRPRERAKHYLSPFGVTEKQLQVFVQRLYDEVLTAPGLVLFTAIVDKVQMQQTYPTPPQPSLLTYRRLFERFQQFLTTDKTGVYGLVIFDKISDAAFLRKEGYENLLTRQHLHYMQQGTDRVAANIVEGLLFIPSAENHFVQLADLCAYNVFRQFSNHGQEWDTPSADYLPLYPFFERIVHCFYTNSEGSLDGYGIDKFPTHTDLGKPSWELQGDESTGWRVRRK